MPLSTVEVVVQEDVMVATAVALVAAAVAAVVEVVVEEEVELVGLDLEEQEDSVEELVVGEEEVGLRLATLS